MILISVWPTLSANQGRSILKNIEFYLFVKDSYLLLKNDSWAYSHAFSCLHICNDTANHKLGTFIIMCYPKYCIIFSVKGLVGSNWEGLTLSRLEYIKKVLQE